VVSGSNAVANFSLSEIPGSITGTVTSAKDRSAIVGATVSDGTRTATTDASGKYSIANVPPGTYQVTASKSGCESLTSSVTVVPGGNVVVNFSLSPKTTVMWVDSIRFTQNRNNLVIEVKVVTASGVLRGAKVGLSVKCSNGRAWKFSGTTDTSGLVKFNVSGAPVGSYLATVNSVVRSGLIWDTSEGIVSTNYAVSSSQVARSMGLGALVFYSI